MEAVVSSGSAGLLCNNDNNINKKDVFLALLLMGKKNAVVWQCLTSFLQNVSLSQSSVH